jgi:hypothetical protein
MKKKKLTRPQLYLLRKAMSVNGGVHCWGPYEVRVARTLANMGLATYDDANTHVDATAWGRQVAETGELE